MLRDGPEAAAAAVAEVVEAVQAAAAEHDVCFLESDIEQDGARIVLVAGAPRVSEHDVERLLRTVRGAMDATAALQLSVGVSRGRVFAGEVGAPFRRTYTILGGTAALAARLMAKARAGQIFVPEQLLELSATTFEVEHVAPLQVKGIAEPVRAVALGAIQSAPPEADQHGAGAPLIGRQREIAVLTAALAPVRLGFGTMLELVGEAGLGKTRLLQELRANADDLRVIGARCDEYESSTPYFVFRSLLSPLIGELDGTPAENTAALRTLVDEVAPGLVPWIPLLALPLDVDVRADAGGARAPARVPAGTAARCRRGVPAVAAARSDAAARSRTCTGSTRRRPSCCATSARRTRRGRGRSAAHAAQATTALSPPTACRRSPR